MTRRLLELGEARSPLISEAFKRDLGIDGYLLLKVKTPFDRKASSPRILSSAIEFLDSTVVKGGILSAILQRK